MQKDITPSDRIKKLDVVLTLAKAGNFEQLDIIAKYLTDKVPEVRMKAAWYSGQIGFAKAIDGLANMAINDSVTDNRNTAIYALAGIGRPAVVQILIAALNDEDAARRDDAQTALYRILGRQVLPLLPDEFGTSEQGTEEVNRLLNWWNDRSNTFDESFVYFMGQPASPGAFIRELKATRTALPDAFTNALHYWTGEDFGQIPLSKVIPKWEKWWDTNKQRFVKGQRYFYGHLVPPD